MHKNIYMYMYICMYTQTVDPELSNFSVRFPFSAICQHSRRHFYFLLLQTLSQRELCRFFRNLIARRDFATAIECFGPNFPAYCGPHTRTPRDTFGRTSTHIDEPFLCPKFGSPNSLPSGPTDPPPPPSSSPWQTSLQLSVFDRRTDSPAGAL